MDSKEIEKLAKLSRLSLSDEEKRSFAGEIGKILEYVGMIQKAVAEEPPREAGELRNVMREDTLYERPLATPEEILALAPKRKGDYIEVKQMFKG